MTATTIHPLPGAPASLITSVTASANRGALSIRWIATAATVLLTAAAVVCVSAVSENNARTALNRELDSRVLLLGRNLALTASGALLTDFPELTLQPVVKDLLASQPEVAFAVVVDHLGVVQGHPDVRRLGTPFGLPAGLSPVREAGQLSSEESLLADREWLVSEVPVREHGGRIIGKTFVGFRRDYLDRTLARSRQQQLMVMGLFLLVGIGAAMLLMSMLLRPIGILRQGLERIGRGDLETPIRVRDRTELGVLADTVNEMTGALRRAQLEMVERLRLTHEVDLARQIQQSLIPSEPLTTGAFTVRGDQRPAAEVGGDYFDYFLLADGRMALAVADVAGKGLSGCLVMSMLSALLRAYRETHTSPSAMLGALDEQLGASLRSGVFVTMFYGILEPRTGCLTYACAGHNPLLLCRRDGGAVETLASKGIPLAAVRGGAIRRTLKDAQAMLQPGDLVVQYTDGYTEAFDPAGKEEFGMERMIEVLRKHAALGGDSALAALRDALTGWTGGKSALADDETLLVLDYAGAPARAEKVTASLAGPVDTLEEAECRGRCLRLPSKVAGLPGVQEWMTGVPVLRDLTGAEADWLASALYEACANVAEHGYADSGRLSFELWWLPPRAVAPPWGASPAEVAAAALREGAFVLRDDAAPFDPGNRKESDFTDPAVRRRGRGIGLDIIHRVMHEVRYHPATTRGNILVMKFGPRPQAEPGKEIAA